MTTTIYLLVYSGVIAEYIYIVHFFRKRLVYSIMLQQASSYVTLKHHVGKEKNLTNRQTKHAHLEIYLQTKRSS